MGRHRRSAAGRATTGRATDGEYPRAPYAGEGAPLGIAPYLHPEAYAETTAPTAAYSFSMDDEPARTPGGDGYTPVGGPSHGRRRKKKAAAPMRTGLLGVSAAVALGTVAVATGAVPGLENYRLGGGTNTTGGDRVQAADSPGNSASEQGGSSGGADSRGGGSATSRDAQRATSPAPSDTASASASAPASPTPTKPPSEKPSPTAKAPERESTPSHPAAKAPVRTSAPVTVSTQSAVEAEVLKLVNEERAKVGCSPVSANSSLTALAEAFSDDMAARGFFDHTDPDGASPWDRAGKAGITDLGGENIARGQTDAAAVMEAWMNSPGHRANILNCDFKTLGVGVHMGSGGPWWTQDFGY
ncbi:CAP domain-containing protein [Streptomyces sp. NPDC059168]|uniref:CAP domain-containing protein n=1 Tax=Streptomyces sp. NPDC059168 TaxID=3346753 RepID=UPI0036C396FB